MSDLNPARLDGLGVLLNSQLHLETAVLQGLHADRVALDDYRFQIPEVDQNGNIVLANVIYDGKAFSALIEDTKITASEVIELLRSDLIRSPTDIA